MSRRLLHSILIHFLILTFLQPISAQTYSFTHDGLLRSYIVHLPLNYNPANQYPLVVNMHGLSNTAAIQETYTAMNAVSDTGNFIIIYPDAYGTTSFNAGFNSPYNSGVDDLGFISALLDTAIANYSIDTLRIYACGMSNGGFMSYRLACELEDRIAAIASVTGSMPDSMEYYCQSSRAVPVMQVHGTTDPTVNYNGAPGVWAIDTTVQYWVQKNGCPTSPVSTAIPNTSIIDLCTVEKFYYGPCDAGSEVVFYKITGGGHTWPGAIPIPVLGNTNQDFNASGEIWNFFRKYSLPAVTNPTLILAFNDNQRFKIWPNPSYGSVHIEGLEMSSNVSILNILGQTVLRTYQNTNGVASIIFNVADLEAGVYFVKVSFSDKSVTQILVKQ